MSYDDSAQAELLNELVAHDAAARCVCLGPLTGQSIATGGDDCALHVWRLGRPTVVLTIRDFKRPVTALAFGPLEGHLAAGSEGGVVKVLSLSSQKGEQACDARPRVLPDGWSWVN